MGCRVRLFGAYFAIGLANTFAAVSCYDGLETPDGNRAPDASGGNEVCVPGDVKDCPCPGGATGAQTCEHDGSSWGKCEGCNGVVADAGGGDEGAENDAGAPVDAGTDAGHPTDAGFDSGPADAGVDAGFDAGTDAGTDAGGGPGTCENLQEGRNEIDVDGTTRSFILNLPAGASAGGPWPVVFNWHGLGDTADNMSGLFSYLVDNADYPFIQVTPDDAAFLVLGQNMNWDVFVVNAQTNQEARLFDDALTCLKGNFSIDEDRVHTTGFSIGSILSDMLGTIRGDKIASIATYSGGYFSNQANVTALGFLASQVSWPAPTHSNAYAQVLLYGGENDTFSMGVTIPFYQFSTNDGAYLNGLGHDAVLCNHDQGHTAPAPGFDGSQIIEFFAAHPRGTADSPYAAGLPADFPDYCTFEPKD